MEQTRIEALEKMGFKRWTKGDYDRLYLDAWKVKGVETHWQKNGKKLIAIDGEELSYTKTAEVQYAKIYIDVKTEELVVDCRTTWIQAKLEELVKTMIA